MSAPIDGATRLACVIGDPIEHSLSPTLHNAAFRAAGLNWAYVAFRIAPGRSDHALAAMRALGFGGMSVTMPHKRDVALACDELSSEAARLQSVNCVVPLADGRLRGESTDGPGFVQSLTEASVTISGCSVLLIGAGGAARAVAASLCDAGARVAVAARRPDASAELAQLDASIRAIDWDERDAVARTHDVVVNCTPMGMLGNVEQPCAAEAIGVDQCAVDLVYAPLVTPWLGAVAARGAVTVDGLGMLVHQAAIAFEAWTGVAADVHAMRSAAEAALAGRAAH